MEGILRWLQSLARTAGFSGETETGQDLALPRRAHGQWPASFARIRARTGASAVEEECSQRFAPTSLVPATTRIRASQAGHWSCARRGRDPARSQSRQRSRRCVRGSVAIGECPPFSCFEATKSQKSNGTRRSTWTAKNSTTQATNIFS